jgi:hypothetical protein
MMAGDALAQGGSTSYVNSRLMPIEIVQVNLLH